MLRQRGKRWQAVVKRNGRQHAKTFRTKGEARAWAEYFARQLDSGVSHGHSLRDALERYRDFVSIGKRGARWEVLRLDKLMREWPAVDLLIVDIQPRHISELRDKRLALVAASSVNREMNLLSNVFSVARDEWQWILKSPMQGVKRPKNPEHRDRLFTVDESDRIIMACGWDRYETAETNRAQVAVAFLLAIETAMRAGEIIKLEPSMLDLRQRVARLPGRITKNGKRRDVPLSSEAVRLLQCVPDLFSISPGYLSTTFNARILTACQIEGATFHDTRHTAITSLAKVLDVLPLAKMVGHTDLKMLLRYYNESASDLAQRLN